jgi:uncharacterized membrane protein affecting hemolysin expression
VSSGKKKIQHNVRILIFVVGLSAIIGVLTGLLLQRNSQWQHCALDLPGIAVSVDPIGFTQDDLDLIEGWS